ncbi:MAG: MaoC family dehydratase N-terminal domain-containing protein [Burkholderiaceae bacterium]|nr:MaoC family dehydratase N-terminal domain-containing protein [Burkholderiaceae bacterium]
MHEFYIPKSSDSRVDPRVGSVGGRGGRPRRLGSRGTVRPVTTPADASSAPQDWAHWLGRRETRHDTVTAAPLAGLAATLDRDDPLPGPGTEVSPLGHWLYTLPVAPQHELGDDGHPRRGGFLPPVPLPRRMWAGGRLRFERPLRVGDPITRQSRITRVDAKTGRSGPLVFVTVRHEIANDAGLALTEEHDIVYRDAPRADAPAPAPQPAPAGATFSRRIVPDPVLLFRYSALTFNGHRIHYDRPYCQQQEGYPGLVVHGPLIATLLVDLLRRERPGVQLRRFDFTAVRPTFDDHPFTVHGRDGGSGHFTLWAQDHEGWLTMHAEAETA